MFAESWSGLLCDSLSCGSAVVETHTDILGTDTEWGQAVIFNCHTPFSIQRLCSPRVSGLQASLSLQKWLRFELVPEFSFNLLRLEPFQALLRNWLMLVTQNSRSLFWKPTIDQSSPDCSGGFLSKYRASIPVVVQQIDGLPETQPLLRI